MQTRVIAHVIAHPRGAHMAWALLAGLALTAGCKHDRDPGAGSASSERSPLCWPRSPIPASLTGPCKA